MVVFWGTENEVCVGTEKGKNNKKEIYSREVTLENNSKIYSQNFSLEKDNKI